MSIHPYNVDIIFELRQSFGVQAENEGEAEDLAIDQFRTTFSEEWEIPPSASDLDVWVSDMGG